jgi:hypothetical protein
MSAKGEMYKSAKSKMKHEKGEGSKERAMEYGKKPVKKAAKKVVKKKKMV